MKDLANPLARELVWQIDLSKLDTSSFLYKKLKSAQEDLVLAFNDWEAFSKDKHYISYIESYRESIVEILGLIDEEDVEPYTHQQIWEPWSYSYGDVDSEEDGDLEDNDEEQDVEWDIGTILHHRQLSLQNKFFDADIYEKLLRYLIDYDYDITKSSKDVKTESKEEWNKNLQICLEHATSLYPNEAVFYTITGYFYLDNLENADMALTCHQKSVSLEPDYEENHVLYVQILQYKNLYQEVDRYINKNMDLDTRNYDIQDYYIVFEHYEELASNAWMWQNPKLQKEYYVKMLWVLEEYIDKAHIEKPAKHPQVEQILEQVYYAFKYSQNPKIGISLLKDKVYKENKSYYTGYLADLYCDIKNYTNAIELYESLDDYVAAWDCYVQKRDYYQAYLSYETEISHYATMSWEEKEDIDETVYDSAWSVLMRIKKGVLSPQEKLEALVFVCEEALQTLRPEDHKVWYKRLVWVYYNHNVIESYAYEQLSEDPVVWKSLVKLYLKNKQIEKALDIIFHPLNQCEDKKSLKADLKKCLQIAKDQQKREVAFSITEHYNKIFVKDNSLKKEAIKLWKKATKDTFYNKVIHRTTHYNNKK